MLLLNLGYDLGIGADIDGISGAIALSAKNYSYRFEDLHEYQKLLIDPQLYLSSLDPATCLGTCAHLATYPWFQTPNIPTLEEGQKKPEFQKKVKDLTTKNWSRQLPQNIYDSCLSAITFQSKHKCTHIILPSPLITEREDEGALQAEWLDQGLRAVADTDQPRPVIATVALDEGVLNATVFSPAGFLDTIVDQTSSRPGLNGVYIVICQTQKRPTYGTPEIVNKAYSHLVSKFASTGLENIILNFADVFGATCIAKGATQVAIGPGQASRTLCLKNYEESGGGGAFPHFFSRKTISEYLSEEDLDKVVQKNLWKRIEDVTEFSRPLVDALRVGGSASKVPTWAESKSNIGAARKHFVKSLNQLFSDLNADGDRKTAVENWLEDADMLQSYLAKKIGSSFPERRAPVEMWLKLIK